MTAKIIKVEKGSIAEKYGILENDEILTVNDKQVSDITDWMILTAVKKIKLEISRSGKILSLSIKKSEYAPLGVVFDGIIFDKIKTCKNKCVFCFVDQEYDNARETMKIKDDDFRLSFLQGNFISLTNLTENDWEKIKEYRLSPLYISVHATNPSLRENILKNRFAGDIVGQLKKLIDMDITVHTQIVLCPGINDKEELDRSLYDLSSLYPGVESVAVVPVGITKYHKNALRSFTKNEMLDVIAQVSKVQNEESFIFLSDEFYIKTGTPIPPDKYYGDYPQIENGIGMMRLFLKDYNRLKRFIPDKLEERREISIITGELAGEYIEQILKSFEKTSNLYLKLHVAESVFWGGNVDVAGLLTGEDIEHALNSDKYYKKVIIPSHCLRDDKYFLDGKSIDDLEKSLECEIIPVEPDFRSFRDALLGK